MHLQHELVEVVARARLERRRLVHQVHHHRLAAADLATQVDALGPGRAALELRDHVDRALLRGIGPQPSRCKRGVVRGVKSRDTAEAPYAHHAHAAEWSPRQEALELFTRPRGENASVWATSLDADTEFKSQDARILVLAATRARGSSSGAAELCVGCVLVLGTARLNSVSTTACSNDRTAARARSFEHAEVSTWRRSAPPRSIGVRLFAFAASTTGSIHQLKLGPCDFRRWATGQPHAICSVCAFDAAARGENHAGAGHAGAGLTSKNGYGRGIARSARAPPERWLLLQ